MRLLLERGVATSTNQIRRVVCSWSKIENRVCEWETNIICANAKPRDVVHRSILMSSSSLGSTMLASLASLMSIANQASKKLNKLRDFTMWSVSLFFNEAILGVGGGSSIRGERLLQNLHFREVVH